jgi:hypothetical protein
MILAILRILFPYAGFYTYEVWYFDPATRIYGPSDTRKEASRQNTTTEYHSIYVKFELW